MESSIITRQIELLWAHAHSGQVDLQWIERQAQVLADVAGYERLVGAIKRSKASETGELIPAAA